MMLGARTSRGGAAWFARVTVAAGLVLLAGAARAEVDPLRWIPADTRVIFQLDPERAASQPMTRQALGLDAILARLATSDLPPSQVRRRVVAYIQEGTVAQPIAFTVGRASLAKPFDRLRGAKLETAGGKALHASRDRQDWTVALVDAGCILEGPRQTLRAVLQQVAAHGKTVADLPAGHLTKRLLAAAASEPGAVWLVYLAPGNGRDLYAILQDLDRTLGVEISNVLAPYQSALRVLGKTQGLRLDLTQERDELATALRLVMPSTMVAQIASVSLQAGKDLARAASDAALKAGSLSQQDALVLDGALQSMQARSDGDLVVVRLRVTDGVTQKGP